jgi:Tol biopolymer transport system component
MADIASRPAFLPRVPWRTIGVALIVIALLLALAVAYVGTTQTKVPPPFGVARNGLVVFAAGGDIYAADHVTGTTRAIVTGPEMDTNPRFSRDGTHVAFMRRGGTDDHSFNLVVARSDGTDLKALTTTAPVETGSPYEWSPDGSFLVFTDSLFRVYRVPANGSAAPTIIRENAYVQPGEFRPPDGREILFEPQGAGVGPGLWVMNTDGSGARPLHEIPAAQKQNRYFDEVRYSPDGTKIAFQQSPPGDTSQLRVFVMNADGTDVRQLSNESGTLTETDIVWSPDSKSIAFDRWRRNETTGDWEIQPLAIASVESGEVRSIGPTPVSDGAWFDFSPDGTSIISMPGTPLNFTFPANLVDATIIDVATGQVRTLDWNVGSVMTWQRLAE